MITINFKHKNLIIKIKSRPRAATWEIVSLDFEPYDPLCSVHRWIAPEPWRAIVIAHWRGQSAPRRYLRNTDGWWWLKIFDENLIDW